MDAILTLVIANYYKAQRILTEIFLIELPEGLSPPFFQNRNNVGYTMHFFNYV